MNHDSIVKESQKWVKEEIITEAQRKQLVERYPKRQSRPLLFTFAAIFIGLGFLTFIASNWAQMSDLLRMGLIIGFLLAFYLGGEWIYRKKSKAVGLSLLLVAFLIFGAGIFLTGQMYHYTSYTAFPFFIWSLAGYGLYLLFKEQTLFIATIVILTVGQVYSGLVFQEFHLWSALVFLLGFGWVVYREKMPDLLLMFGLSYLVQSLVFVFSEGFPYYWLLILFLGLYLAEEGVDAQGQIRVWKTLSVLSIIIFNIFEVFLLGEGWLGNQEDSSFAFFIVWAVLFVYAVIRSAASSDNYYWIDLILFVPVFRFGFGDVLSLGLLFAYSLLWLSFGYQKEIRRWVNKGTVAFLISTLLAYFQLAWDFMDRSLFFFIGGLLLFGLSFFLERKRRHVHKGGETI